MTDKFINAAVSHTEPRFVVRETAHDGDMRFAVLDTRRVIYVRYFAERVEAETDAASRSLACQAA